MDNHRGQSAELPGMLATLCSYENHFGPHHPQTLRVMALAGIALLEAGEIRYARPLLERAVRELGRRVGAEDEVRVRAAARLRDLLLEGLSQTGAPV